jgi:transcriptional regulator with XRE-family HTH domain
MGVAEQVLHILGDRIRIGRHAKGWTAANLGARLGVTARTVSAIESGSPGVAIGTVLNAAALTGVDLISPNAEELARIRRRGEDLVALLPARTRSHPEVRPDDFDF